jgi:hypothetical protein
VEQCSIQDCLSVTLHSKWRVTRCCSTIFSAYCLLLGDSTLGLLFIPEESCDMVFRNVSWFSAAYMGMCFWRLNCSETSFFLNYGTVSEISWTQCGSYLLCTIHHAFFHRDSHIRMLLLLIESNGLWRCCIILRITRVWTLSIVRNSKK